MNFNKHNIKGNDNSYISEKAKKFPTEDAHFFLVISLNFQQLFIVLTVLAGLMPFPMLINNWHQKTFERMEPVATFQNIKCEEGGDSGKTKLY